MLVKYEFPDGTSMGSEIIQNKLFKTTVRPVLFLKVILYGDKNLPKGVILH